MKYLAFILLFGLLACNSNNDNESVPTENAPEELIVRDGNSFKEYYSGKKQLRMEGNFDDDKNRHGIWKFYAENGVTISITEYRNGIRSGISMVYFANGKLNYKGEYENDKPVGIWKMYDEKTGELTTEKNYDQQ